VECKQAKGLRTADSHHRVGSRYSLTIPIPAPLLTFPLPPAGASSRPQSGRRTRSRASTAGGKRPDRPITAQHWRQIALLVAPWETDIAFGGDRHSQNNMTMHQAALDPTYPQASLSSIGSKSGLNLLTASLCTSYLHSSLFGRERGLVGWNVL